MESKPNKYPTNLFAILLDGMHHEEKKLINLKGGEYSGDDDRLANFRRYAERLELDYRQVWAVYAGKHWDAIMQYIKDIGTGTQRVRSEPLRGRIMDLRVYLGLFLAMVEECEDAQPKQNFFDDPKLGVPTPPKD